MEQNQQNQIQFQEVKFIAPIPLIEWLNEQAKINGIDADQFLNALLYAVWGNYNQNQKYQQDGLQELSPQPQGQGQTQND